MKKAYRIISVLAAAAITAASLALTGCGDTTPPDEEVTIETEGQVYLSDNSLYTYTLNKDNTATLVAYNGDAASVVLNRIDGRYIITAIAEGAFAGNTNIKKIELDKDIRAIGEGAFYSCTKLETVEFRGTSTLQIIEQAIRRFP